MTKFYSKKNLEKGTFVNRKTNYIFYKNLPFVAGLILKKDYEGAEIRSMVNAGLGSWKWPSKEDVLYYFKNDIVCIIAEPHVKNNRGHYTVPEMAKYE